MKLKKFEKFENAHTAVEQSAAVQDGRVSSMLSNLLQELKDETKASCTSAAHARRDPKILTCRSGCR